MTAAISRSLTAIVRPRLTSDGAGVLLRRVFPHPEADHFDPFLLLDEFGSAEGADYIAGFPDHPHRGIETVTYMLAGRMRHGDSAGHGGVLEPGGAQWMTAGRGIIHSEMPEQEEGLLRGFQLWVNLPAAEKMRAPRYQNFAPGQIPEAAGAPGVRVKVVAGAFDGVSGPVEGITVAPLYLDVALDAGAGWQVPVPPGHTALVYVYEGEALVGGPAGRIGTRELGLLGDGDLAAFTAGPDGARLLLLAARPLNEPVVRWGPFVMNTREQIFAAVQDYQEGRFLE